VRPFSLSEELGESRFWFGVFSVLGCDGLYLIGLLYNGMRATNMHEWEGV